MELVGEDRRYAHGSLPYYDNKHTAMGCADNILLARDVKGLLAYSL